MKKRSLVILLLIALVFALVGCGKKTSDSKLEILSYQELQDYNAERGAINIVFKVSFGTEIQNIINEHYITPFVAKMKDEHNVDVKVELSALTGGYQALLTSNQRDLNTAQCATISVGYPDHIAGYLIPDGIQELTPFIEHPEYGYSAEEMADFVEDYMVETRMFDTEGTYYGLPFNKSTEAMYYNADFFGEDEARNIGIHVVYNKQFADEIASGAKQPLDRPQVPKTWEDIDELNAKYRPKLEELANRHVELKAAERANEIIGLPWLGGENFTTYILGERKFYPAIYDSGGNLFTTLIHQNGGEYTKPKYRADGTTVDVQSGTLAFIDNEASIDAIYRYKQLANNRSAHIPAVFEQSYGSGPFGLGQNILNIGSTGGSNHYGDSKCEWNVAPIPYFRDKEIKQVIQQGTNLIMFKNQRNVQKTVGWLFIKFMLEPQNNVQLGVRTGYLPVRKSSYELPEYKEFLTNPSALMRGPSKVHNGIKEYNDGTWKFFVDPAWATSSVVRSKAENKITTIMMDEPASVAKERINELFKQIKDEALIQ